eukprot:gene16147-biopygen3293
MGALRAPRAPCCDLMGAPLRPQRPGAGTSAPAREQAPRRGNKRPAAAAAPRRGNKRPGAGTSAPAREQAPRRGKTCSEEKVSRTAPQAAPGAPARPVGKHARRRKSPEPHPRPLRVPRPGPWENMLGGESLQNRPQSISPPFARALCAQASGTAFTP